MFIFVIFPPETSTLTWKSPLLVLATEPVYIPSLYCPLLVLLCVFEFVCVFEFELLFPELVDVLVATVVGVSADKLGLTIV